MIFLIIIYLVLILIMISYLKKIYKLRNIIEFIIIIMLVGGIFIGGFITYEFTPKAKDLVSGKLKVKVIETSINDQIVRKDTIYYY